MRASTATILGVGGLRAAVARAPVTLARRWCIGGRLALRSVSVAGADSIAAVAGRVAPLGTEPIDRLAQTVVEVDRRLPPELLADLVGTYLAAREIARPLGDEVDSYVLADEPADPARDLEHRDLPRPLQIVGLLGGPVAHGEHVRRGEVPHVHEATILVPLAGDGQSLAG